MPQEIAPVRRDDPLLLPPADFHQWLRDNTRTIGGSSVGAILGLNRYKTAGDVWDGLLNRGPNPRRRAVMDRGHAMEPIIAAIYAAEANRTVTGTGADRIAHPNAWWLHATSDRTTYDPVKGRGILEIKCLGLNTFAETKQLGIDPSYYAQLQHYLYVLDVAWGSFAIFNAEEWELYWFDVPRDEAFITQMVERLNRFWRECVLARIRPTTAGEENLRLMAPVVGAEAVDVPSNGPIAAILADLRVKHESRKLAEHAYEQAVERAKTWMTDAGFPIIRLPGVGKVRWVPQVRRTLDHELLRADYPTLDLTPYMRATETRPFVPTWEGARGHNRSTRAGTPTSQQQNDAALEHALEPMTRDDTNH